MIVDFIINIVFNVIRLAIIPIEFLPDVSLPLNLVNSISNVSPYYSSLSMIFPIGTLLVIVTFDILFEVAVLTYKLIRWGYQKIPFIN